MDILYQLAGAVWRCMYRSSMIKDNKVGFPVGLKLSEDRIFNIYCTKGSIPLQEKIES